MIRAELYQSRHGVMCGFKVVNHGDEIVCAAVSILCTNTINSIEALTSANIVYDYNQSGGFMECSLPDVIKGEAEPEAGLLLNSFALGLVMLEEQYPSEIKITEAII